MILVIFCLIMAAINIPFIIINPPSIINIIACIVCLVCAVINFMIAKGN